MFLEVNPERSSNTTQQIFESPQSFAQSSFNQHLQNIIPGTSLTLNDFQGGFRQMNRNPSSYRAVGEYRAAVNRITEPRQNPSTLAADILHGENHASAPGAATSSASQPQQSAESKVENAPEDLITEKTV